MQEVALRTVWAKWISKKPTNQDVSILMQRVSRIDVTSIERQDCIALSLDTAQV